MIKKQKKWIAGLVTLAFVCLLQVSSMPLGAAGAREEASAAGSEQGPDFFEVTSYKPAPAKKSIVPYVLIGVGVAAVAAVLVLVVFKTKYDIVGKWNMNLTLGVDHETNVITFTGSKGSGTWDFEFGPYSGTYTVSGKKATMVVTGYAGIQFTGTFTAKDTMTGTWINSGDTWNWTATRVATTSVVKEPISVSSRTTGPGSRK